VELLGSIPEERRILVTSERAFQYLAARYGLREGYVWAIDTDEQGTPLQILDLVRFVRTNNVPALFVESNKDPRAIETVSRETGVPIYAKVYSDELGVPDEGSGTFLGMMEWTLQLIYSGRTGPCRTPLAEPPPCGGSLAETPVRRPSYGDHPRGGLRRQPPPGPSCFRRWAAAAGSSTF